jgi:hypothetical protein
MTVGSVILKARKHVDAVLVVDDESGRVVHSGNSAEMSGNDL